MMTDWDYHREQEAQYWREKSAAEQHLQQDRDEQRKRDESVRRQCEAREGLDHHTSGSSQ